MCLKNAKQYIKEQGEKMNRLLKNCQSEKWDEVELQIIQDPQVAKTHLVMNNGLNTTVLHQAITSKGDNTARLQVIHTILDLAPTAAAMTNGFGSFPLHALLQRNVKMSARRKEETIGKLVDAHPAALLATGGKGKRTPLHILFTDYIAESLAAMMISKGPEACFIQDKKGFLPIHVACNRHCTPEKLRLLVEKHPASLFATTHAGETPLMLAKASATESHKNNTLIAELEKIMIRDTTSILPENTASTPKLSSCPAPVAPVTPDFNLPATMTKLYQTRGLRKRSRGSFSGCDETALLLDSNHHSSSSSEAAAAAGLLLNVRRKVARRASPASSVSIIYGSSFLSESLCRSS